MKPFLIGITGGTGSGKSTFAKMIAQKFPGQVLIISQDMYYKDQSRQPLAERKKANMDCPDALDNDFLAEHLILLKRGIKIESPIYDFTLHTRIQETKTLYPKKVIVVEGILVLSTHALRHLLDLKIYVELDADLRLARRILRDVKEKREKSLEASVNQYLMSAYPMHKRYVEPQKEYADLVIPWGRMSHEAVNTVAARIEEELEERGEAIKQRQVQYSSRNTLFKGRVASE